MDVLNVALGIDVEGENDLGADGVAKLEAGRRDMNVRRLQKLGRGDAGGNPEFRSGRFCFGLADGSNTRRKNGREKNACNESMTHIFLL